MTHFLKKVAVEEAIDGNDLSLDELNHLFAPLQFQQRLQLLFELFEEKDILITSSFGTTSVFLLHLLSQIRERFKVHTVNTGYLFPETLEYKNQLSELLNFDIEEIHPDPTQHRLTTEEKWWTDHPRMCCTINKIVPLEPTITQHKIWISGLMAFQNEHRSRLNVFEQSGDVIKFYPLIDVDEGEQLFHISKYDLPPHPLQAKGYGSVGCTHCTKKGEKREGRWAATKQSECGLHTNHFFNDKNQTGK